MTTLLWPAHARDEYSMRSVACRRGLFLFPQTAQCQGRRRSPRETTLLASSLSECECSSLCQTYSCADAEDTSARDDEESAALAASEPIET